jgi:hypothetical protein
MSDNSDLNIKNGKNKCCSQLSEYIKRHMAFRKTDESLVFSGKT